MSKLQSSSLFDVSGKVVLVTGGSRGIGKMIARGFVENGAKVYISSRTQADCDASAKELSAVGPGTCIALPAADLQKLADAEKLVENLSNKEKLLHVLVNNAGATWGASLDEYPDHAFSKIMMLNVQRVFTVTQKCLPLLRAAAEHGGRDGEAWNDPSRIINIGSFSGIRVPSAEMYAYTASKAAVHHLSRNLAGRLGWEGITSNTIAAGPFKTKMMKISDQLSGEIPLGRAGRDTDIAGTALYLSSQAGRYVNGATIALDGGYAVAMPAGFSKLSAKL